MLREVFGIDLDLSAEEIVFVGDLPDDTRMFEMFRNAVGVANVKACANRSNAEPTYVTARSVGHRFAKFVNAMLEARNANETIEGPRV